jgi:hypothetical protein
MISQRGAWRTTITASPGCLRYALASAREATLALMVKFIFIAQHPRIDACAREVASP